MSQQIHCGKECVASCTIILKPDIVHINALKIGCIKIDYHGAIGVSVDRNGCAVLIFKEILCLRLTIPTKQSFVMDALASVRPHIGFLSPK